MQIEVQELESAVAEAEKRVDVQEKTCFLLPNAEENIEKLEVSGKLIASVLTALRHRRLVTWHFYAQKLIEKNSQRILTLGKMWEERRVPLINELRELKRKTDETSQVTPVFVWKRSVTIATNKLWANAGCGNRFVNGFWR